MAFAVIQSGGKQYKISKKSKVQLEKIPGKEGDIIEFDTLLRVSEKNSPVEIGTPFLQKKVKGKILRQMKGKKIEVIKYKPKTRYRRKKGHRQLFTEVEITQI